MEQITAGATIIGLINVIKMQFPEIKGIYAIGIALVLGILMGWFGFLVADVQGGIIAALISSGIYKLSQNMGR